MNYDWSKAVKRSTSGYDWSKAIRRSDAQKQEEIMPIYHGQQAIAKVEEREGPLTPVQRRVVELEGFAENEYEDTKGILTSGVGQTNQYMSMSFKDTFSDIEGLTRRLIKGYENYPEYLQAELVQAAYRGDLQQSPTFRRKLNAGQYEDAAVEFLDHKEYLSRETPAEIKRRLESVSDAVKRFANEMPKSDVGDILDKLPETNYVPEETRADETKKELFNKEDEKPKRYSF